MTDISFQSLLLNFVQDAGLFALVAVGYSAVSVRLTGWPRPARDALLGTLFALGGVMAMAQPVVLAPGVFIDQRAVVLAESGLFGGPIAVFVTTVTIVGYRIMVGGAGVVAAMPGTLGAALVGLGYAVYLRWVKREPTYRDLLVVLACLAARAVILFPLLLVANDAVMSFEQVLLPYLLALPISVFFLGSLLIELTRRRALFDRYQETERRFRSIAAHIPGIIYQRRMTPEGEINYPYMSPGASQILGVSGADAMRDPSTILGLIRPSDREEFHAELAKSAKTLTSWARDFRIRDPKGAIKWLRGRGMPRRMPNGDIIWDNVLIDVTSEKTSRLEIMASEARFKLLADEITDVITRVSTDGTRTYVSPSVRRILGYEPEELVEKDVLEIVHPSERAAIREKFEAMAGGEQECEYTCRCLHKDGRYVWMEIRRRLVRDPSTGEPRETVGAMRDITMRKELELALRKSEIRLRQHVKDLESAKHRLELMADDLVRQKHLAEEASAAKSAFLANMSHELRTPLNAVIGFSEVIRGELFGATGSKKYVEYAAAIHDSGQHLLGLINDILDLSKVEAGRLPLHEEAVDVGEVLGACMRILKSRAVEGRVALNADIAAELPPVMCDERRFKQILFNLMSNAIKFTLPDGIVTATMRLGSAGDLIVEVRDTGVGIAPDDQAKVMDVFVQVDNGLNRKLDGTGLGLPLTKRLVELHGGTLSLESDLGVGTTVTARLPAHRVLKANAAQRLAASA